MLSEDIKPLFMGKWNTVCTMVERSCVSYTVFYSEKYETVNQNNLQEVYICSLTEKNK